MEKINSMEKNNTNISDTKEEQAINSSNMLKEANNSNKQKNSNNIKKLQIAENLSKLQTPEELRKLDKNQKELLAEELRQEVIQEVSKNGGHLASNLGVVELTIALHSSFDTPNDKIIWDVGHQTYVHKMLTGRRDKMDTLRKINGKKVSKK